MEALPRWRHPSRGLLLPGDFIELAEDSGLIMELGDVVLMKACQFGRQVGEIVGQGDWTVNVNLSPRQLQRPDFLARVQMVLSSTGLLPSRLCFEVTEDLILEELPTGSALFTALRELGVKLCMDDFGTGYSSLSYLHRFRFDFLKIETAFVHAAETTDSGVQIVRSLINLARNLGLVPIAEGVESCLQWQILRENGCPRAQGYLFQKPASADELIAWLSQHLAACA
jgi:EAL domain-containing protein (putative c-di-GMP-specific phosphodiesterase class I)